ncbi:MAG: hypothetical protein QNJ98_11415 [Planctomycetota bacterium]|nr:hypothetical protein [Planctomycetota bacterium]
MSSRVLLPIALLVALVGVTTAPSVADAGQAGPAELETLKVELKHLKKQLGTRKALNEELIEYLRVAAKAYPELDAKADAAIRREILDLLRKGLRLKHVKQDVNTRLEVNVATAGFLGKLAPALDAKERTKLATYVERQLDELPKARFEVESEHIEALANLLGHIGEARSLSFLQREYLRTETKLVPYIVAAMKAMLLFEDVKPAKRFELVDRASRLYAPLETAAETSSTSSAVRSKKQTWDQIRTHVIAMMQKMARTPVNEKGEALSTVKEFQRWLRENDDYRRAPWTPENATRKR